MTTNLFLTNFLSTLLGVTLPIITGYAVHLLKKWQEHSQEKREIISLFNADINRNWSVLDSLRNTPAENYFSRTVHNFKGVEGINLAGIPEYQYSLFSLKLFNGEGIKLAKLLKRKMRESFWDLYNSLNDLEETRIVLSKMSNEDINYNKYQELFKHLSNKCYNHYLKFVSEI